MKEINAIREEPIIVSHPAQQHSYLLCSSLIKCNLLHSYCTTIYYREEKLLYKILKNILDSSNFNRLLNRRRDNLDAKTISLNEILGLFYLLIVRVDKNGTIRSYYENLLGDIFGNNVYKYSMKSSVKVVVAYDKFAYKSFLKLKDSKVIKVLDMSSIPIKKSIEIINEDYEQSGIFKETYDKALKTMNKVASDRNNVEILLSDYIIVASEFTKRTILEYGVKEDKVFVARYGIDISKFSIKNKVKVNSRIKFLFVGRISATKGIHHLLEVFKKLKRDDIELQIVGSIEGKLDWLSEYSECCTYLGLKSHDEMPSIYQDADVFVLPTMFDGASLAIVEAMASGLPVITTSNAGNSELIVDKANGIVYNPTDLAELERAILYFVDHKGEIAKMGQNARREAEKYTIENYEKRIAEIFNNILSY